MSRAVVAFPGRGAYGARSLGSLTPDHPWVQRADELRAGWDLPRLSELDALDAFDPPTHLRPAHADPLAFLVGMLDAERIAEDHDVVGVVANASGWATALAAAGALDFDGAFRLVQELALLAEQPLVEDGPGGRVIYPLAGSDWRPDAGMAAAVEAAVAAGGGDVHPSVELGGWTILAGTESGVDRLLDALPRVEVGRRSYPMRLALDGPQPSPFSAPHLAGLAERLGDLAWMAPRVPLVDGRGARWTPTGTDPEELARYTLGEQITSPYRFAASLRVALREYAPEVVVLPGPGNSLGGICGQLIVTEGYHGIRSRRAFEATQAGRRPILLSLRR